MSDLPLAVPLRAGGVNRDYYGIYKDLQSLIPHFTKEWTYHGEDDLGVALLQLFSYLADHLHYRADAVFRDSKLTTTQDRYALEKMAQQLGYFPLRKAPAACEVTFTLASALTVDFTIPAGTRVQAPSSNSTVNDAQDITFELKDPLIIPAGSTSATGVVHEGSTRTVTLGIAEGVGFETFEIPDAGVVFNQATDDLKVRVNGVLTDFTIYASTVASDTLAYTVNTLRGDLLEVTFGDGVFGARLSPGDNVTATYRVGGGKVGLVAAGAITTLLDTLTFQGQTLSITVSNASRSVGGTEAESNDSIRVRAPAYFRTQNRAVTLEDYRVYTETVPGVRKCKPMRAGVNGVVLYILPDNASEGFTLTNPLIRSILNKVSPVRMATDAVSVLAAKMVPIEVELKCFAYESQQNAAVRRRVLDAFLEEGGILNANSGVLGQHLKLSDMIGKIEGVEGVDYLDVVKHTRRPVLEWVSATGNAALAGAVTLTNDAVEETYTITFLSSTTYAVSASVSGVQTEQLGGVGVLGTAYTVKSAADSLATFQIDAGSVAMAQGDRGTIRVSALASNIKLSSGEFPIAGTITVTVEGGI